MYIIISVASEENDEHVLRVFATQQENDDDDDNNNHAWLNVLEKGINKGNTIKYLYILFA